MPVRIVLVGSGRAGRVHANSLVHHVAGGTLVGLVDASPDMLRATGDL